MPSQSKGRPLAHLSAATLLRLFALYLCWGTSIQVFDSLAGFVLYTSLVRSTPLPVVATYAYVTPVIRATLGLIVLDEPLSPLAGVGAAVGAQLRARPTASA